MAECFVEEFLMMGYNHKQLLALFRNPHYLGMNMVLQDKGEPFVKEVISDVFARWGKKIEWPGVPSSANGRSVPPHPGPLPGRGGTVRRSPGNLERGHGGVEGEIVLVSDVWLWYLLFES